ncbi:methyltransferase family protein [Ekhidna sp.]|uniref:methyltransferase family protein n=1 Tax=Ekhidna sp. TaxID=2608089 RepID=UPI003C7D7A68
MKLKIPPVVIFFFSLGVMFGAYYFIPHWSYSFSYQTLLSRICLALGVLVAFSGIIAFRMKRTTVDPLHPEKASSLVTSGIYQYTRNPMYLGMALVLIGGLIRIGNPLSMSGVIFFIWYLDRYQIRPEEESLIKVFGKEYVSYCEKVGRWL